MVHFRTLAPALAALAAAPLAAMDSSGIQIHGFASQGYLRTTTNELYGQETTLGTFSFNEFAVNMVATPVDRVRVGVQLFSNALGDFGHNEVKIDWAYGEYQVPVSGDNSLALTAGRFKTGHGLYNDFRDLDVTRTAVFLPESVYAASFRDFFLAVNGAGASSTLGMGGLGSLDSQAWVGTQEIDTERGPIAETYLTLGFVDRIKDINVQSLQGGSLNWNAPVNGLRFKGSLLTAKHLKAKMVASQRDFTPGGLGLPANAITLNAGTPVITDVQTYANIIVGGEYQIGDLTFASEYSNAYWKAITDTTTTTNISVPPFLVAGTNPFQQINYSRMQGYYGSVSYRFHPKWEAGFSGNWQYEKFGAGDSRLDKRVYGALSLRFDPTEHWLIKAEFERNKGALGVRGVDNSENGKDVREQYWNLFAVKTTFDF